MISETGYWMAAQFAVFQICRFEIARSDQRCAIPATVRI
jgi:hypothetical protein